MHIEKTCSYMAPSTPTIERLGRGPGLCSDDAGLCLASFSKAISSFLSRTSLLRCVVAVRKEMVVSGFR